MPVAGHQPARDTGYRRLENIARFGAGKQEPQWLGVIEIGDARRTVFAFQPQPCLPCRKIRQRGRRRTGAASASLTCSAGIILKR